MSSPDDIQTVHLPRSRPVFSVGDAHAYRQCDDGCGSADDSCVCEADALPCSLIVHMGEDAYDAAPMSAVLEQAELHGFPVLTGAVQERYTNDNHSDPGTTVVTLTYGGPLDFEALLVG